MQTGRLSRWLELQLACNRQDFQGITEKRSAISVQREAGADFVAGAFGAGEGFEEQELVGGEGGGGILPGAAEGLFQWREGAGAGAAFGAGEGDVRVVRAIFGEESAGACGGGDLLLQGEEFGRENDAGMEDADAIEEVEAFEPDGDGNGADCAKVRDDAGGLVVGSLSEKLEGDVPALFGGPAEIVTGMRSEAIAKGTEGCSGVFGQRDGDEQPHGRTRG